MSSTFSAPKLSEVLRILSEQANIESDESNYENVTVRSKNDESEQVSTETLNHCESNENVTIRSNNDESEQVSTETMNHCESNENVTIRSNNDESEQVSTETLNHCESNENVTIRSKNDESEQVSTETLNHCESNENVTIRSENDESKQMFTDAVNYCVQLLRSTGRINENRSEIISDEATLMGHEMFERITNVGVQMDFEVEDEFFSNHSQTIVKLEPQDYLEGIEIQSYSSIKETEETSSMASKCSVTKNNEILRDETTKSEYMSLRRRSGNFDYRELPPSPVSLAGSDDTEDLPMRQNVIPLEIKKKVVALARAHPNWTLASLQINGSTMLRNMEQLRTWEKQVANGGTKFDKYRRINDKTYEKFLEARAAGQRVSTVMLRQWAVQIARECYRTSMKFDASKNWATNFKKMYRLQGNIIHGNKSNDSVGKTTVEELKLLEEDARKNQKKRRRIDTV